MRFLFRAVCFATIVFGATVWAGDESTADPAHVRDAKLLVANVAPEDNDYDHKGCYIHWKDEDGATRYENHTDCSDFLNLLLKHTYHFTTDQYKQWTGHMRPTASEWHSAVLHGKGFDQIETFKEAQIGDYLIVKYPPGHGNTGHVMLICDIPRARHASRPIEPDTDQWDVPVIDSSESGHGKLDTRRRDDGKFNRGVGQGILRIYTGADGKIAGYTWSNESVSVYRSQDEYDMVIGRLNAVPVTGAK
jgi:hypothetical protein